MVMLVVVVVVFVVVGLVVVRVGDVSVVEDAMFWIGFFSYALRCVNSLIQVSVHRSNGHCIIVAKRHSRQTATFPREADCLHVCVCWKFDFRLAPIETTSEETHI